MANFREPQRHIFGTYLNMARVNFHRTILHVLSASNIDCYTLKGDLFVKETTVDKIIDFFYHIIKQNETESAFDNLYEIVSKIYNNRWAEESKSLQLGKEEESLREAEFKAPLHDEGPQGEKAHLKAAFTLRSEQEERLRKMLFKHIPILAPMMAETVADQFRKKQDDENNEVNSIMHDASLADCLFALSKIALCLSHCRNFYTHANPYNSIEEQKEQFKIQDYIAQNLNKAFVASRRIAKKRNGYTDNDLNFLTGHCHVDEQNEQIKERFCREEVYVLDENNEKVYKKERDKDGKTKCDKNNNPIYVYKKVVAKDKNGKPKLDQKGKKVYIIDKDNDGNPIHEYETKFPERKGWYFRLLGEKKLLNPDLSETGETVHGLSAFGILYFCSLFLSKEQTAQLCTESEVFIRSPFQNDNNKSNNIILNMMYVYRTHIPRGKRLDSERDSQALAMDMLNELRRCPMELYNVLPTIGKREFEDIIKHENNRTPEIAKRIRSNDRFPYLALRYIDMQKLFDKIRFQVRLGSYRFCFYDKICIDGKIHPRQLHKEINGFGRWQDMEQQRKEQYGQVFQKTREQSVWQKDENAYVNLRQLEPIKPGDVAHITNSITQYNIHENRIGLYWNTDDESFLHDKTDEQGNVICEGYYLPTLATEEIPNTSPKKRKAPIVMPAPLCSLSIYELPAMLFYQHLCKEYNLSGEEFPSAEVIIINQYDNLVRFFKEVKDIEPTSDEPKLLEIIKQYGLNKQSVPKKIYNYLSKKSPVIQKDLYKSAEAEIKNRLKKAIIKLLNFESDQEKIENIKENKYGKDSFTSIRYAKLAEVLAKSMMEWQSANSKMTGINYRILTATLAKFGDGSINQNSIIKILEKGNIRNGDNPHRFIEKAIELEQSSIEGLYLDYINAEINYLKELLDIEPDDYSNDNKALLQQLRMDEEASKKKDNGSILIHLKKEVDFNKIPFMHESQVRWQKSTIAKLAERYLKVKVEENGNPIRTTLLLPDGLFTPYIKKAFMTKHPELIKQMESLTDVQKKGVTNNASYLINLYYEAKDEKAQPFYDSTEPQEYDRSIEKFYPKYGRGYDFFKTIKGKQIYLSCEEIRKKLEDKETLIRNKVDGLSEKGNYDSLLEAKDSLNRKLHLSLLDMLDNERAIRRCKTQDRILFMMAKDIMSDTVNQNSNLFKLENVCKEEFLNQKVEATVKVNNGNYDFFIHKADTPIKDYGKLYRLLNDERMVKIISYLLFASGSIIEYEDLDDELKQYDALRSSAIRYTQSIEDKRFIQAKEVLTDPDNDNFYQGGKRFRNSARTKENQAKRNNFASLLGELKKFTPQQIDIFSPEEQQLIKAIRNAFNHNSYPSWSDCCQLIQLEQETNPDFKLELKHIAAFLIEKLDDYVRQVNQAL